MKKQRISRYSDFIHQMRTFNKKYWPHQFRLNNHKSTVNDIERWCYENFDTAKWRNVGYYFVFKNEQDATFFALRWT